MHTLARLLIVAAGIIACGGVILSAQWRDVVTKGVPMTPAGTPNFEAPAPKLADGGLGPHGPSLLGARRVGEDLFLCATLPGATPEDVRLATEACRDISVQAAPK